MQADHGVERSFLAESDEIYKVTCPDTCPPSNPAELRCVGQTEPDDELSVFNLTASVRITPGPAGPPRPVTSVTWDPNASALMSRQCQNVLPSTNFATQTLVPGATTTGRIKQTARKYFSLTSVKERRKRVTEVLHRAKTVMRESFREEDIGKTTLTTQKSFQRIRHVWVDVDLAQHQLQYYALLLLYFKKQLDGSIPMKLDIVEMVSYLRVAANAVELLPDSILNHLILDNRCDVQALSETFTDMLNVAGPSSLVRLVTKPKHQHLRHALPDCHAANDPSGPHCINCELCAEIRADTRLQPCGHTFHNGCLIQRCIAGESNARCPRCETPVESVQEASLLEIAVRQIGAGVDVKLNNKRPWVLSNKFQKIIDCLEFELAKAAAEKTLVRFVVVADYKAMVEGFSRTLTAFGKINFDVIAGGMNKLKIPSTLVKFGASVEPRLLLYHSSAVSLKHDLSSTTHVYFMTPWREQEVRRIVLNCVLRDNIAGPAVLVADFVATDSIEAEALQVNSSECSSEQESSVQCSTTGYTPGSWCHDPTPAF